MKLFAVACLTGATAQSGDYDDRGSVGTSDYYNGYDNYDEFGNKKKKQQQNWFGYGAKQFSSDPTSAGSDWAAALNCWPANIEADQIVSPNFRFNGADNNASRNPVLYPNQKYNDFGPQHVFGSFETTYRADQRGSDIRAHGETSVNGNHQEDPVLRSGLGGLYQFGHDTYNSLEHNVKKDDNSSRGTHWQHYKQARHAGCLYEKSDWHYGHQTFDSVFTAAYYQGYSDFNGDNPVNAYVDDDLSGADIVEPVWWHFFNAHVLPNGSTGVSNTPRSVMPPNDSGFRNVKEQKSIPLVMANPAYEGLGYLNFVVEYKYTDFGVGDDYREFIDSSPGGNAGNLVHGKATYRAINDCSETNDGQECSGWGNNNNNWNGVHGFYYYDLYMGSWAITKAQSRTWTVYPFNDVSGSMGGALTSNPWSLYDGVNSWYNVNHDGNEVTDWSRYMDLSVSSFPHNNLGKDFRFNLRVLQGLKDAAGLGPETQAFQQAGNTAYYSYYFYKINEIHIEFPFPVAYALYNENRKSPTSGGNGATTGSRIDAIDVAGDKWWNTLNQDADNHPANHGGDPANYVLQNPGFPADNPNSDSSGNNDDYQFLHRSASDDNANIIPPVDLGSHAPNGGGFHRIRGFIQYEARSGNRFADWCSDASDASGGEGAPLETTCGKNFYIKGLMNTYDERRGQRGTYQEIWVQLSYAMGAHGRGTRNGGTLDPNRTYDGVNEAAEPFQSPWPYNHFMASEIVLIQAVCNTVDVNNANTCKDQPAGPGQPNDSFYGGK